MSSMSFSRRHFLGLAGASAAAAVLGACQPAAPQVVKETVVVEKTGEPQVVKETVVVEKPGEQPLLFPQPVKVDVWCGWQPFRTDNMRAVLDRFKEENPNFDYELTMVVDDPKFLSAVAAGVPPDLYIEMDWHSVGKFAKDKTVLALDPFIDASKFDLKTQLQVTVEQCRWIDGKLYGMAWGTDVQGLMWNKDLFQGTGVDPETPPKTWEELFDMSAKLNKKQGQDLVQCGFIPDFGCCPDMYFWIKSFGGSPYSEDNRKLTINTPEAKRAMEYVKSYYDRDGADTLDRIRAGFGSDAQDGFYAGKVALAIEGEWTPAYAVALDAALKNYGIASPPAPADKPELAGTAPVGGTVMVIPSAAKHPQESWKLFMFLVGPWATGVRMKDEKNIPTNVACLNDPRFTEDPDLSKFMAIAFGKNAFVPTLTPITTELGDEMGRVQELILHGKVGIEEGLAGIETKLQPLLDEGWKGV